LPLLSHHGIIHHHTREIEIISNVCKIGQLHYARTKKKISNLVGTRKADRAGKNTEKDGYKHFFRRYT